jgi:hypothetical protein
MVYKEACSKCPEKFGLGAEMCWVFLRHKNKIFRTMRMKIPQWDETYIGVGLTSTSR